MVSKWELSECYPYIRNILDLCNLFSGSLDKIIKDPFSSTFNLIPNAYKTLMTHIKVNNISMCNIDTEINCSEKEYNV